MIRNTTREALHRTNAAECDAVEQQWQGADCQHAVAAFLKRKSR